jgi:hypothetical protein
MELFNTTGFEVGDRVFVVLEEKTYYGTVKEVDERLQRLRVDISADKNKEVLYWFKLSFWKKVE